MTLQLPPLTTKDVIDPNSKHRTNGLRINTCW